MIDNAPSRPANPAPTVCKQVGSTWRLERTVQCEKCPWRKGVDPREIPRGYSEEKHRALSGSIANPDPAPEEIMAALAARELRVMSCHDDHEAICIGWLHNQRGPGNNVSLRLYLMDCANLSQVRVCGEQHATFEETLPPPVGAGT